MSRTTSVLRGLAVAGTTTVLVALPTATASAHVGMTADHTAAGGYALLTVAVPHGCDGSATTKVSIQMPASINAVTPTVNDRWQVRKVNEKLTKPVTDAHGTTLTERVAEVVYTAKTPLPDGYRDAFQLSLQLPDQAGTTVAFPTIQTCVKGETAWIEAGDEDEVEHPAPSVTLTGSGKTGHGGSTGTTTAPASPGPSTTEAAITTTGGSPLGWAGLALGLVGAVLGGLAFARTRRA